MNVPHECTCTVARPARPADQTKPDQRNWITCTGPTQPAGDVFCLFWFIVSRIDSKYCVVKYFLESRSQWYLSIEQNPQLPQVKKRRLLLFRNRKRIPRAHHDERWFGVEDTGTCDSQGKGLLWSLTITSWAVEDINNIDRVSSGSLRSP